MKKSNFIFTMLLLLFLNCSESPWQYPLGNDYFYLRSGGVMDVDVYNGDAITYNSLFEDPIVFPEIEKYKFNSNFIVCKQNYDKTMTSSLLQSSFESRFHKIYYQNERNEYLGIINYIEGFKNNNLFLNLCSKLKNKDHIGFTEKLTDSIINNNQLFLKMEKQKINYYIIDKKRNKNYLVLNKNEFENLINNLKIPDSLYVN